MKHLRNNAKAVCIVASVLLFNWFFIEPKFSFHTYETEYAVTFAIMLISSLITGTLATPFINGVCILVFFI